MTDRLSSQGGAKVGNVELTGCSFSIDFMQDCPIEVTEFGSPESYIPGTASWGCDLEGQVAERALPELMNIIAVSEPVNIELDAGQGRSYAGRVWVSGHTVTTIVPSIFSISLSLAGDGELTMTLGGESSQFGTPLQVGVGVYQAVHTRATELLLMFLEKKQAEEFEKEGSFQWHDEKGRLWTFRRQFHYPVQVAEVYGGSPKRLCFDFDSEAPVEDLLLLAYLEVKGGRGDKLIEIGTGARNN